MLVVAIVFLMSVLSIAVGLRTGWALRLAADIPNARSLHSRPVARVGGFLVMPWVLLGIFQGGAGVVMTVALTTLMVLSFVDDRYGVPILIRFSTHLLFSFLLVQSAGVEHWAMLLVLVLALGWMTNLYNFMDGSDGLAGGMAVFGFGAYGVAASLASNHMIALSCFCIVAGALAFLCFNFPPAKVFLGDSGSIPFGFLAGAFGLLGVQAGIWSVWFPVLVFSPFIVDASLTIVHRALRKEKVWQAHRDHYYQRLVRMGWGHKRTALAEYCLMLATGLSALWGRQQDFSAVLALLVFWLLLYLVCAVLINKMWNKYSTGGDQCA